MNPDRDKEKTELPDVWVNSINEETLSDYDQCLPLEFTMQDHKVLFKAMTMLVHGSIGTDIRYRTLKVITVDTAAGSNLIDRD